MINVRYATTADNQLLAEIGAETFFDSFAADNSPENMAAYLSTAFGPDIQRAELADPDSRFLIAEMAGETAGFAQLKFTAAPAEIAGRQPVELARVYSRKAWIGQGVGAALMARCLEEARAAGCDVIWLGVWEQNPRAIRFYAKWGFTEVGAHIFQLGDDPQRDLLMARQVVSVTGGADFDPVRAKQDPAKKWEQAMTPEERNQKIESYGKAHQQLEAALERFPREMWQFRPAPDRWTIHEIVVHITDSEANSYVRCRRFLAEPGGTVLGYDESGWARQLRYHDQSTDDALALFKWLRHASYKLIKDLPEAVWSNTVNHSENGVMTMDDWLNTYERHIPEHIAQMQAVFDDWLSR